METLTIFTPTYNRADLLDQLFESLKRQSLYDFIWLIIDDGSTDHTKEVVDTYIKSRPPFKIQYVYKENGGLHTGYNKAIEIAQTELMTCIDSDDWITDQAVSTILTAWQNVKREDCAGIVALDAGVDGKPVFYLDAQTGEYINLNEYDLHHKWGGDRKLIIKTELYKSVAPMQSFNNEKNFNPQYMHLKIAQEHVFYVLNEAVCIVNYQDTGMSAGIFRQYLNSPNSFAEYRRLKMTIRPNTLKNVFRQCIHYDSSCILARKPLDIVGKSPKPVLTVLAAPLGFALSLYIKKKAKV